jgi:hypothetical protein
LLAACGDGDDAPARANSVDEFENRIESLAVIGEEETPQRLSYLRNADLWPENRARPACRFHQGGNLILVANAAGAVLRVDGQRRALIPGGPVGPTGAYYRAAGVTVSIGRIAPVAADAAAFGPGGMARLSVGGREDRPIERHEGRWICGA